MRRYRYEISVEAASQTEADDVIVRFAHPEMGSLAQRVAASDVVSPASAALIVNELRDEHRDREWVDAYGRHWAYCDDAWAWRLEDEPKAWGAPPSLWRKVAAGVENTRPEGIAVDFGPGPFMEAVHHRAVWGKEWTHR